MQAFCGHQVAVRRIHTRFNSPRAFFQRIRPSRASTPGCCSPTAAATTLRSSRITIDSTSLQHRRLPIYFPSRILTRASLYHHCRAFASTRFDTTPAGSSASSSAHDNIRDGVLPQLPLTAEEEEAFSLMVAVVDHYSLRATLRVAGGWVRNKLLGLPATDVDIAIDSMTGEKFCNRIVTYQQRVLGLPRSSIYVTRVNPEKSKHLATATIRLEGLEVDIANLRTEVYASDSRVPEVCFGTAHEDALRRDFTINSLFYNLHTGLVEDATGKGLDHLRKGVLCTPMAPLNTFKDDPLRVLRAVRFASSFSFALSSSVSAAIRNPTVYENLPTKVSVERVGIELSKMLVNSPVASFRHLRSHGLVSQVFPTPPSLPGVCSPLPWTDARERAGMALLENTYSQLSAEPDSPAPPLAQLHLPSIPATPCATDDDECGSPLQFVDCGFPLTSSCALLASFLVPTLRDLVLACESGDDDDGQARISKSLRLAIPSIVRPSLLSGARTHQLIECILISARRAIDLPCFSQLSSLEWQIGDGAAHVESLKTAYRKVVKEQFFELALWLRGMTRPEELDGTPMARPLEFERITRVKFQAVLGAASVIAPYLRAEVVVPTRPLFNARLFYEALCDEGLVNTVLQTPILTGHVIQDHLHLGPGPEIGRLKRLMRMWELKNPDGTQTEAVVYLHSLHKHL